MGRAAGGEAVQSEGSGAWWVGCSCWGIISNPMEYLEGVPRCFFLGTGWLYGQRQPTVRKKKGFFACTSYDSLVLVLSVV